MTDRHIGYVVTLDGEIRSDDAEAIINAIAMIKGVIDVSPVIADAGHGIAVKKAKQDLREKLFALLD